MGFLRRVRRRWLAAQAVAAQACKIMERLASFVESAAGKRLTYKALVH
jgi:hypothetical protein